MSIGCRQYEINPSGIDAIIVLSKKNIPIHIDFEKNPQPRRNRLDGPEMNYESLINCQHPDQLFSYKVEDDIFAFMEFRLERLAPILRVFTEETRITYNSANSHGLKIEVSYWQSSQINIRHNPFCKIYKSPGRFELESEIPIESTKGYPLTRTSGRKAATELLAIYRIIDNLKAGRLTRTA